MGIVAFPANTLMRSSGYASLVFGMRNFYLRKRPSFLASHVFERIPDTHGNRKFWSNNFQLKAYCLELITAEFFILFCIRGSATAYKISAIRFPMRVRKAPMTRIPMMVG